jgi:hypothetical protein
MTVTEAILSTGHLLNRSDQRGLADAYGILSTAVCWDDVCTSAARGLLLVHSVVLDGTCHESVIPRMLTQHSIIEMFNRTVLGANRDQRLIATRDRFSSPQQLLNARPDEVLYTMWLVQVQAWSKGSDIRRAPVALLGNKSDTWCQDLGEVSEDLIPVMRTLLRDGIEPLLLRRTAELL